MATRFIVVQHAEKEAGPGDPGLSLVGAEQASAVADRLATLEVAAIETSPARRAVETARPISQRLGAAIIIDGDLRERMNWNGDQSLQEFLTEWATASRDREFEPQSGQSSHCAGRRLERALRCIAEEHGGGTVVVITHGGVTVDMARNLVGDEVVEKMAPGAIVAGLPPCSITKVVEEQGLLRIKTLGGATG